MTPTAETETSDTSFAAKLRLGPKLTFWRTPFGELTVSKVLFDDIVLSMAGPEAGRRKSLRQSYRFYSDETDILAFHEAGHVIAARILGVPVFSATIIPSVELGCDGHVRLYPPPAGPEEPSPTDMKRSANRLRLEWCRSLWFNDGQIHNWKMIRWIFRRAKSDAKLLLYQHWRLVEAVAGGLLTHKILTGEQIDAIIAGVRQVEVEQARTRWSP
jgi:hypothetical protein